MNKSGWRPSPARAYAGGVENVVFIITDNQSPWTLGCYGNDEIRTPNIDRLAAAGLRFTNGFCSNPVCSPGRATCLTGLVPSQHGVHSWLGTEQPDAQMGPQAYCTIEEFPTLPRLLAAAGYRCGLSGKWHLGDSLHPQLGFDYWYTKPKGHTHSFYNADAIWEGRVYQEPRYSLSAISDHAVAFLETARSEPFFLYVGFNGPYGLDQDLREGHRNRHTEWYADKPLRCFPRGPAHPWQRQYRDCLDNDTARRSYAAAVSGVDDGVGTILAALDNLDLASNTLVVFTADHGLCAGHHGCWGMSDHSWPRHLFQENLRVPLIFRHPGHIPAGRADDTLTANYDLFPSLLEYLGLGSPLQGRWDLPGRSYADALRGAPAGRGAEAVYHEYEDVRAVQTADWKLVKRHPDGPDELYRLADDPGERHNRIGDVVGAEVRRELESRLAAFFARFSDRQYDLWQGGRSKAGLNRG
ncbi:sulfatase-like hydrolase/transferase [bacterium]|nr:sulfatase-like hydrolase/transferase [bacterium]